MKAKSGAQLIKDFFKDRKSRMGSGEEGIDGEIIDLVSGLFAKNELTKKNICDELDKMRERKPNPDNPVPPVTPPKTQDQDAVAPEDQGGSVHRERQSQSMKIKSIKIKNFRGAKEEVALESNRGRSVLLYGDNGSGKSSFLDAVEWFV